LTILLLQTIRSNRQATRRRRKRRQSLLQRRRLEEQSAAEAQKQAEDDLAAALGLGNPPEDPKKRVQWWKTGVPYSQLTKALASARRS
jgi:hypothetical protein